MGFIQQLTSGGGATFLDMFHCYVWFPEGRPKKLWGAYRMLPPASWGLQIPGAVPLLVPGMFGGKVEFSDFGRPWWYFPSTLVGAKASMAAMAYNWWFQCCFRGVHWNLQYLAERSQYMCSPYLSGTLITVIWVNLCYFSLLGGSSHLVSGL